MFPAAIVSWAQLIETDKEGLTNSKEIQEFELRGGLVRLAQMANKVGQEREEPKERKEYVEGFLSLTCHLPKTVFNQLGWKCFPTRMGH